MASQLEEIQTLKKEIQEIKKQLLETTTKSFGRAYSNVGTSNSDFLIKTKGQVKIQWGNKFIDLIKNGKINVDAKFIYKQNEVGVKDGIYVIGDDQVILQVGGAQINLKGDIGTSYVSFQGEQKTSAEQKYTALTNIGFLYKTLDSVDADSLKNGVIYVESEQKLYIVQNGTLQEFSISFPNPLTEQLVIQKTDESKGSLLIVGNGINNSLAFDNLYFYTDQGNSYIDSNGDIYFRIGNQEKVRVTANSTVFSNTIVAPMIQSQDATQDQGFRLYTQNNLSTLEVDNLVVRNTSTSAASIPIIGYQWYYQNNVIVSVKAAVDDTRPELLGMALTLAYVNTYIVNQKLYVYYLYENPNGYYQNILLPLNVEALDTEGGTNTIYTSLITDELDQTIVDTLDYNSVINGIKGRTIFLIAENSSDYTNNLLRTNQNTVDLIKVNKLKDAITNDTVTSRFGNIEQLNLKGREAGKEVPIEGTGLYSNNGAFLKAQYTKDYVLPEDDSSTKFASTEWVNKSASLPVGTIVMYNGTTIPTGWAICDGTNGTPNLIDKVIKGSTTAGNQTQPTNVSNKEVPSTKSKQLVDISTFIDQTGNQLLAETTPEYYSLIFIMKIQ